MTGEAWLPEVADAEDLDDVELLGLIRAAYEDLDPVPDHLIDRIGFELTLAMMFDEVARLQQVESTFSGARAAEQIRTITFSGSDVSLMLTVNEAAGGRVRIDGWVAPGSDWNVGLSIPGSAADCCSTVTDAHGRFVLDQLPAELAQFTLHRGADADRAFTTPLIQL